jgi:hypothetical protein
MARRLPLLVARRMAVLTVVLVVAVAACGKRSALKPDGSTIMPTLDGAANDVVDRDAGAAGGAGGAVGTDAGGLDVARPDVGVGPSAACAPDIGTRVPPAPLRRLTNFAYSNTLRDQLGVAPPPHALPPAGDVSDDPATLDLLINAYHGNAHELAVAATKDAASVAALTQCDPAALGEATCAQRFVAAFVPKLFRRPLEDGDATDFGDVFAKGREIGGDYASGVRAVVEVALQSPEFLYLVEFGEPVDSGQPGVGRPRPYEMATRLSYLLLGSAPDDGLRAAAAQDQLRTKEQVQQQAIRLLADPRAHDVTRDFYTRLLRAGELESRLVLAPPLAASAGTETSRFIDDVVWVEGRDLKTLLGAPFTVVDDSLAQVYGVAGVTGTAFRRVSLPAQQRRGVLTQISLLASRSTTASAVTHPSERGATIFTQLLCGDLSSTPPDAAHAKPPRDPGETASQWLARVTAPAACHSCHGPIDSLGLAFEHYGASGIWRDGDGGIAIDARGTISGIDTAGSFDGAIQLVDRLAASRDVQSCHVRKWMESGYGRPLAANDACSREELEQAFASTGGNIVDLMIRLTQTDAFLYRPAP